jgi:hypothetical protein
MYNKRNQVERFQVAKSEAVNHKEIKFTIGITEGGIRERDMMRAYGGGVHGARRDSATAYPVSKG